MYLLLVHVHVLVKLVAILRVEGLFFAGFDTGGDQSVVLRQVLTHLEGREFQT